MAKHNARAELALSVGLTTLTTSRLLFIAFQLSSAACHAAQSLASVRQIIEILQSHQPVRDLMMRPVFGFVENN